MKRRPSLCLVELLLNGATMHRTLDITSTQNPRLKTASHLRERRARDASGLFLIEGYREISRANAVQWPIVELFYCRELFLGSNEDSLITALAARGTILYNCTPQVFAKLAYRDRPDGLVAVAKQQRTTLSQLAQDTKEPPLLLLAEAIEKPGNLGTMLRSADAVGAHAVLVCDRCTDIFNPNVVRASVGTLFTVPVIETTSQAALEWLRSHKITVAAATPHASLNYTQAPLGGPLAIAVGTEQLGLSEFWLSHADTSVAIPMRGTADSLNVATAATLMLYEALRQRQSSSY
jgi:TrmH family RNA methyltransferase